MFKIIKTIFILLILFFNIYQIKSENGDDYSFIGTTSFSYSDAVSSLLPPSTSSSLGDQSTTIKPKKKYNIKTYVWMDYNFDGNKTSDEPYLAGISGILYDTEREYLTTKAWVTNETIDDLGSYEEGHYCIVYEMNSYAQLYSQSPRGDTNVFDENGQYCFILDRDVIASHGFQCIAQLETIMYFDPNNPDKKFLKTCKHY